MTSRSLEYDSEVRMVWHLVNFAGIQLSLKLAVESITGGYNLEILDFSCPAHPEIDWAWIDRNRAKLFETLQLGA